MLELNDKKKNIKEHLTKSKMKLEIRFIIIFINIQKQKYLYFMILSDLFLKFSLNRSGSMSQQT